MLSRRDFLSVASATAVVTALNGRLSNLAAQQRITQADLLKFEPKGQVTILHMTDCHSHLMPLYYREPSVNLGVGAAYGKPPHLTGEATLKHFGLKPGSLDAYALTYNDFVSLAKEYGRVGGMDRMATLVKAIRSERGEDKTLFLDGGDTLQGSYTSLKSKGADMIKVLNALDVEATTGHWEFTYGMERVLEFAGDKDSDGEIKGAFLAGNVFDTEWEEPVFKSTKMIEKNGINIAVIGQAFPFTPIANPRYLIPNWSFGIREKTVQSHVEQARASGADLVVLLSHNGFDTDRKMASRVDGIDVILTAHTHDAVPLPVKVNKTLLIGSGSHTKFLSRLDLEVKNKKIVDFSFALIPVLTDAIQPDKDMEKLVNEIRSPHQEMLNTTLGKAGSLLYRRGNFNGTFDDLICNAIVEERDCEISLSPGFRWGASILPGQDIKWDDIYSQTSMTYPACYRLRFKGSMIKDILEDVADNLFNPDPYFQQGGDMVRVGGMGFEIDVDNKIGNRIKNMTLLKTGTPIEADKEYVVGGWASVNEGTEGPAIWDVVGNYIKRKKTVNIPPNESIKFSRQKP